jgi:hypothetical protein
MAGIGPAPKPASKRRRRTPPKSYGAATPIEAPAAEVIDHELRLENPHPLVERMWDTVVQEPCESRFYSPADWMRLRLELWHANELLTGTRQLTPTAWAAVQHGLNAMLISPAEKRRAAIEVRPVGNDPDADAAVLQIVKYQDKLKPT